MTRTSRDALCPACGEVVSLENLTHEPNIQKTTCSESGDALWREWGGPENPGWDRAISPHGWSRWQLEKYR
jgi:hypothetical protein